MSSAVTSIGSELDAARESLSRSQLHAIIGAYTKSSSLLGWKAFALDLGLYALGIGAVIVSGSVWIKVLGGIVAGGALVALGALLHEAAHKAVVPSRRGNKLIAVVSMTLCLFNYRLWVYDHHVLHHRLTNVKDKNFFSPRSMDEYRAMSPLRRALYRAYHTPAGTGVLLYFLIERWPTIHFWPGSYLPQRFRRSALGYAAGIAAFGAALLALLVATAPATGTSVAVQLLCGFVLPYTLWFATFSMTVYLQHTHPEVRWYRDAASAPPEALSVHVGMPHLINHMSHYGLEHPVHHISAAIPHYRLKAAQAALASVSTPPVIQMRFTPANLRDVVTRCRLYDYEQHLWLGFDGSVTARPEERSTQAAERTVVRPSGPSDQSSPSLFFPTDSTSSVAAERQRETS